MEDPLDDPEINLILGHPASATKKRPSTSITNANAKTAVNPNMPKKGRSSKWRYPTFPRPKHGGNCVNSLCKKTYSTNMNGWRVGPEGAGTLCQKCHNKWLRGSLEYKSTETPLEFKAEQCPLPIDDPDLHDPQYSGCFGSEYVVVSAIRYRQNYGGSKIGASYPGDSGHLGAKLGGKRNKPVLQVSGMEHLDENGVWVWSGPPKDYRPKLPLVDQTAREMEHMAHMFRPGYKQRTKTLVSKRTSDTIGAPYTFHGCLFTPGGFAALLDTQRPRIDLETLHLLREEEEESRKRDMRRRSFGLDIYKHKVNENGGTRRKMPVFLLRNVKAHDRRVVSTSVAQLEMRKRVDRLSSIRNNPSVVMSGSGSVCTSSASGIDTSTPFSPSINLQVVHSRKVRSALPPPMPRLSTSATSTSTARRSYGHGHGDSVLSPFFKSRVPQSNAEAEAATVVVSSASSHAGTHRTLPVVSSADIRVTTTMGKVVDDADAMFSFSSDEDED